MDTSDTANRQISAQSIWKEIQSEKRGFKRLMTLLTALFVLTAFIVVGMFLVSQRILDDLRAEYTSEVRTIKSEAAVSRGDAMRKIQNVLTATIKIREELTQASESMVYAERARAIGEGRASDSDVATALAEGRLYTVGAALDPSRELLMRAVFDDRCMSADTLGPAECLFLNAVLSDWDRRDDRDPGSEDEALRLDMDTPRDLRDNYLDVIDVERASDLMALTPYAEAGLSQLYFAYADNDQLGRDRDCQLAIEAGTRAIEHEVDGVGPFLMAGECLRKQGQFYQSNQTFAQARDWYEDRRSDPDFDDKRFSQDIFRQIYHGFGTTGIAVVADEAQNGQLLDSANLNRLNQAESNLFLAADLRQDRGEGDVGRVYTTENVGFIYVLERDWPQALFHTAEVDKVVPLAWNLIIRRIAAGEIYASLSDGSASEPSGGLDSPEKALAIACDAERVLLSMPYEWYDKEELLKLLPNQNGYHDLVEQISSRPFRVYQRREQDAQDRINSAQVAFPTAVDGQDGTPLCQPNSGGGWWPF